MKRLWVVTYTEKTPTDWLAEGFEIESAHVELEALTAWHAIFIACGRLHMSTASVTKVEEVTDGPVETA